MIRVLLADDHSLVRAGLKRVIEEATDIRIVAEASTGVEAISEFNNTRPDVVVMDISMPEMDGLESANRIMFLYPDARILILSRHHEENYAIRILKAGCLGYITKGSSTQELHDAIRAVARRQKFLSEKAKDIVTLQLLSNRSRLSPVESLSDREFQVLCLVAQGQKLKEIAAALGLSVKTIETYHANVRHKLSLRNDVEICRFAFDNGLIDDTVRLTQDTIPPPSPNQAIPDN